MDIKKIKLDDFVSKVNDISKDPQQKVALTGFVGNSPNDGCIRIYHDASLGDYSEVNADDVIHQEPLQNSSLGGSAIWVKGDAKVSHGNDSYHYDAKKDYFEGALTHPTQPEEWGITSKTCTIPAAWGITSKTYTFPAPGGITSKTCTEFIITTTATCPRPTTKTCTFPPPDVFRPTSKTCPRPTRTCVWNNYDYYTDPGFQTYYGTGNYDPYSG